MAHKVLCQLFGNKTVNETEVVAVSGANLQFMGETEIHQVIVIGIIIWKHIIQHVQ